MGAKAKLGEREGKIDNVMRLEIIQQEQVKIDEEAVERVRGEREHRAADGGDRLAQASLEQAKEEQSVRWGRLYSSL